MWLSTIRQATNLLLNIAVNTLIHVILETKYKDNNIYKRSLAPEESTYRETKWKGKCQKGNGKEGMSMGQSNEEEGPKYCFKSL